MIQSVEKEKRTYPDPQLSNVFNYQEAFKRNRGLVSRDEQEKLRNATVAIPGLGGVGASHAIALARSGVGRFILGDFDSYELSNFNRQMSANIHRIGMSKAEAVREDILNINPDISVTVWEEPITADNVSRFLEQADILLDGVDLFSMKARRAILNEAERKGIHAVIAGPLGFSCAMVHFAPGGMGFDKYFDMCDGIDEEDMVARFVVGLSPKLSHSSYMDMSEVDLEGKTGPSLGLACMFCSAVAAAETVKAVLGRGRILPAPHYIQIDLYKLRMYKGKLRFGGRGPIQKLKRYILMHTVKKLIAQKHKDT
ncbi:ThiF family adenylyltransferase [Planctomycetota bacterium]